MKEFKAGDRIRLEGVVLGRNSVWTQVRLDGSIGNDHNAIKDEVMARATIIPAPEQEKKMPELDTNRPIREKMSGLELRYIGRMSDGRIAVEYSFDGTPSILAYHESELENVPEPKRTMSREVVMVRSSDGTPYITFAEYVSADEKIIARRMSYLTEGDGMEVQS